MRQKLLKLCPKKRFPTFYIVLAEHIDQQYWTKNAQLVCQKRHMTTKFQCYVKFFRCRNRSQPTRYFTTANGNCYLLTVEDTEFLMPDEISRLNRHYEERNLDTMPEIGPQLQAKSLRKY